MYKSSESLSAEKVTILDSLYNFSKGTILDPFLFYYTVLPMNLSVDKKLEYFSVYFWLV